jgi:serine/threonine-protein kinase HipA
MMRTLEIYVNKTPAGVLTEHDDGTYSFRYGDAYFRDPAQSSVSLTMPKTRQEYRSATLFPFFANMLSEGVNRRVQSRRWHIDEADDFGLLAATATVDTIGAITVKRIEQ